MDGWSGSKYPLRAKFNQPVSLVQRVKVYSPHWPSLERRVRRSCVIVGSWGDIPAVLGSQ